MKLGTQVGLSHIVLDGVPAPPPQKKRHSSPQFSAHVYCGQTAGWIKVKLSVEVGLGPGHIVLDGDPALPPPRGHSPQFLAHVCCGQKTRWIKIPLGREVGLGPGNIVLDGDPAPPPPEGHSPPPIFGPCLLWPNGRPSQLLLSTCEICKQIEKLTHSLQYFASILGAK